LAARVDSYHEDPSGSAGKAFLDDVARKIQKILEPPPLTEDKPLPAPDDRPKKRRGGRRMRKLKQKFEMTDLRKQANRTPFGLNAQEEIGDSGKGMGFIGMTGGGKLRLTAVDKGILKKTKKFTGTSGKRIFQCDKTKISI
jgi:U4/U6 small nuclear ribonucleoprotein PRP31